MAYSTDMKRNTRAHLLLNRLEEYLENTIKSPGVHISIGKATTARFWYKVAEFYPIFKKYEYQIPPAINTLYQLTFLPNLEQLFKEKVITRETSLKDSKELVSIFTKRSRLGRPSKPSREWLETKKQLDTLQVRFDLLQARYAELNEKYIYALKQNEDCTCRCLGTL